MSPFVWSFLAGLLVLWVFAFERFDVRTWKAERRFARMLTVLNPSDLRGNGALLRAFLVYTLIWTALYVIIILFVSLGVLAWEGGGEREALGAAAPPTDEPGSWVPLSISLAMVGLAPSVPILQKLETKLRNLTHRMMGVPSILIAGSEDMAHTELPLDDIGASEQQRAELERYIQAARAALGDGASAGRLERALAKILAFQVWVVEEETRWPPTIVRNRYAAIEEDVTLAKQALFEDLEDLSARTLASRASAAADKALTKRWDSRIRSAVQLCEDICALMFLYAEKAPLKRGRAIGLIQFLTKATERQRRAAVELDILLGALLALVFVAVGWGGISAFVEEGTVGARLPSTDATLFGLTALVTYGPAMFTAFWLHRWNPEGGLVTGDRPVNTSQLLFLFAVCSIVAYVSLVALNVGQAMAAVGFHTVGEKLGAVLAYALQREALYAGLGGIQGVFVALCFDLDGRRLRSRKAQAILLLHGIMLFVFSYIAAEHTRQQPLELQYVVLQVLVAGVIGWMTSFVLIRGLSCSAPPSPVGGGGSNELLEAPGGLTAEAVRPH